VQEKASTRDGGDRSAGCVWVKIGTCSYNAFIVSYRALCLSQFSQFLLVVPLGSHPIPHYGNNQRTRKETPRRLQRRRCRSRTTRLHARYTHLPSPPPILTRSLINPRAQAKLRPTRHGRFLLQHCDELDCTIRCADHRRRVWRPTCHDMGMARRLSGHAGCCLLHG
jgi:hypothetical protein